MTTTSQSPSNNRTDPTIAELRHRAEVPMLVMAGIATLLGVAVAIYALVIGEDVPTWAQAAAAGLGVPIFAAVIMIRYSYWKVITNAVEISEDQLPETYSMYVELAAAMGVSPLPRLYVTNGNGVLNAFASKCQVRRHYIVFHSDLLDIAYTHNDFKTIRFILAHELAHVKCGHVDLWRTAIVAVPVFFKFGSSVTRAQEYTADRCAAYYAPEGASGMLAAYAGKNVYQHCDMDAYLESVENHKEGFWLRVSNFLSSHAVGHRRVPILANLEETGWDVHGKML